MGPLSKLQGAYSFPHEPAFVRTRVAGLRGDAIGGADGGYAGRLGRPSTVRFDPAPSPTRASKRQPVRSGRTGGARPSGKRGAKSESHGSGDFEIAGINGCAARPRSRALLSRGLPRRGESTARGAGYADAGRSAKSWRRLQTPRLRYRRHQCGATGGERGLRERFSFDWLRGSANAMPGREGSRKVIAS